MSKIADDETEHNDNAEAATGGTNAPVHIDDSFVSTRLTSEAMQPINETIHAGATPSAPSRLRPAGTLKLKARPTEEPAVGLAAPKRLAAAFYFDGFNLYHALDELGKPYLKWLNLRKLAEHLIDKQTEDVTKLVWCSAEPSARDRLHRHKAYQLALDAVGVEIKLGHFINVDIECRECNSKYSKPNEKCGDVNVAIHAVADGLRGNYDVCYIVTADSDQAATLKFLKDALPDKRFIVVAPPRGSNERRHSQYLLDHADGERTISDSVLVNSVFERAVLKAGRLVAMRPAKYDPPVQLIGKRKTKMPTSATSGRLPKKRGA